MAAFVYLASKSPRRQELLRRQTGVNIDVCWHGQRMHPPVSTARRLHTNVVPHKIADGTFHGLLDRAIRSLPLPTEKIGTMEFEDHKETTHGNEVRHP